MSIKNIVNELPVATWNHLGVNGASIPVFPTLQERKAFDLQIAFPWTIEFKDISINSRGDDALEEFVYQNKNAHIALSVTERVQEALHIRAQLSNENNFLCESIIIDVEENVTTDIFHVVSSEKDAHAHYAGLLKLRAKKGSNVHLTIAELLDDSTQDWTQLVIEAEDGANVEVVRILLGAKNRLSAVKTNLIGEGATFALNTYYHVESDNVIDINDVAIHTGKNTDSDMYIGGILDGTATKIYRGTIDFRKGAVKATGKEIDDVLLMSPSVHNRTCPLILCGEESVAGEHAATIGRFNDEQLFYLCSRGLSVEQAKQLLVDAKLYNVVSKIKDESLQEKVIQFAKQGNE